MKDRKKFLLSLALFFILLFFTVEFILKDYSITDLINAIKDANKYYIYAAIFSMFMFTVFGAIYNKRFLHHFKKKISWYHAFGYVYTEVYFSGITPSSIGGQPVEMIEMNSDGISYQINSIMILINAFLYKLGVLLIAMVSLIFYYKDILYQNRVFNYLLIFGFIVSFAFVFGLIALVYSKKIIPALINKVINIAYKLKIIKNKEKYHKKIEDLCNGYKKCAEFTKEKPIVLVESFIILLGQKLSQLTVAYLIYKAFGGNSLSYLEIVGFQACINLAVDFIPVPGGMAVSESLLLKTNEFIYGLNYATSAVVLYRAITYYLYVLVCGILYLPFHFIKRNKAKDI